MGLFWFIFGVLLTLIGAFGLYVGKRVKAPALVDEGYGRSNRKEIDEARGVKVAMFVVGGFLTVGGPAIIFLDSFHVVDAKNVGVVQTFGKATGTLNNGWAWVEPWSSVIEIDGTNQNINMDREDKKEGIEDCVTVRLANQTSACVDLTLQWHISGEADANTLYQAYRGQDDDFVDRIRKNVVKRELINALNSVFEIYNPLAVLSGGDKGADNSKLTSDTIARMRSGLDRGVVLDKLLISFIHFDDVTQAKLNAYAQALADTQIATQQKLTAEQQRAANETLAATAASNNQGVMFQNCLNTVLALAAKNQLEKLPQTFNCNVFGGGQTPVIVGSR